MPRKPSSNRKDSRALRRGALVALLVLGLALVAPHAPWSGSPRAESDRAAISRSGVLGGASYLIEVPAKWQGGLVVFAHGIQRGSGPGAVGPPPIGHHILAGATRGSRPGTERVNISLTCSSRTSSPCASSS
jgi:hypothetical protein